MVFSRYSLLPALEIGGCVRSGNKMNHGEGRKLRRSHFIVESVSIRKKNRTSELFGQVEIWAMES